MVYHPFHHKARGVDEEENHITKILSNNIPVKIYVNHGSVY